MKRWSRRQFLEAGVLGTIVASSPAATQFTAGAQQRTAAKPKETAAEVEMSEKTLLRMVMDELIPASDGMPAASGAGGLDYVNDLVARNAHVANTLSQSLVAIEEICQQKFRSSFTRLPQKKRVAVLTALERQDAENFEFLRDLVYEAYYEQLRVWELVGYVYFPTNGGGPVQEPFQDEILSEVRKKPTHYRSI